MPLKSTNGITFSFIKAPFKSFDLEGVLFKNEAHIRTSKSES